MRSLLAALLLLAATSAHAGSLANAATELASGTLIDTFFIFSDNQLMATNEDTGDPDNDFASPWGRLGATHSDLEMIANGICAERDTYNIKGAISMGDIVRRGGRDANAWTVVDNYTAILQACRVPYLPAYGNHDGDDNRNPQQWNDQDDAQFFDASVGATAMGSKGWFSGSRGAFANWDYCITANPDGSCATSNYLEASPVARTYWVPLPPFNVAVPEWQYGIRLSTNPDGPDPVGTTANNPAADWLDDLRKTYPHDYWIHVTHAGPCDSPINCDLTPSDLAQSGRWGYDWASWLQTLGPQYLVFLNGHWGRGGNRQCWGGAGTYNVQLRDDGSRYFAAGFDNNCGTRLDPEGNAANNCPADGIGPPTGICPGPECIACPGDPYVWNGWMTLKRATHEICMNTVRMIDVDADNDGTPNSGAGALARATLISPPEFDRGTLYSEPDPLDVNATLCQGALDAGPNTGCPNPPETCAAIVSLPD